MQSSGKGPTRRAPRQDRSRQTVVAVLDAVDRVVRRHGVDAVTTNRIADAAGVSIGSLYQYFPDKQAIFAALHERHVDEVRQVIEHALAEYAAGSFEDFTRALVERLADVHAASPELHDMISAAVPNSSEGFQSALRATFERAIAPAAPGDAQRMLFVLPPMVEALVHGVAQRRPPLVTLDGAKREAVRAVVGYVSSCRAGSA